MNRKVFITALAVAMTIGTGLGFAQMMGPGQHMYGGQGSSPGPQMMEDTDRQAPPPVQQQNTPSQMYPGMMGYGGYGMGPGMMGYNMMGPGQWGGCGGWYPGATNEYAEKYNKALDETRELRRKLNALQFDYNEALRNPEVTAEKKKDMAEEIFELNEQIRQKMNQ